MADDNAPRPKPLSEILKGITSPGTQPNEQGVGRPTKIVPERVNEICLALSNGLTRKRAAEINGIGRRTFYDWMERGLADQQAGLDTAFSHFAHRVTTVESECAARLEQLVYQDATQDSKTRLEWLARRDPAEWGNKIDLASLPDDRLVELLEIIAQRLAANGQGL